MPTYEYECAKGHRFERFQQMTGPPLKKCPKCKSSAKRMIGSGAGILFKGSGFYQTDYRSGDYKKKAEAEAKKPDTAKTPADKKGPAASKATNES